MILKLIAALAALSLLAGICLAADKAPVNDNMIVDQVRIKLSGDPEVKGGALVVDSKEGVVSISGTVETNRQKDKATKLAKKVHGVKQVINNIEIKKHG